MGSKIMKDLLNYLDNRYAEIHLGWMKENKEAKKFWKKMVLWHKMKRMLYMRFEREKYETNKKMDLYVYKFDDGTNCISM